MAKTELYAEITIRILSEPGAADTQWEKLEKIMLAFDDSLEALVKNSQSDDLKFKIVREEDSW